MRIILTGGTGFIGYPVLKNLIALNHEVLLLGRNFSLINNLKIKKIRLDLNNFIDKNEFVLNIRFDLFSNSYIFPFDEIVNFINTNYKNEFKTNIFLRVGEYCGIDNIYIGSVYTNYSLISYINLNLDEILKNDENKNLIHPEFIVSRINSQIFKNQ